MASKHVLRFSSVMNFFREEEKLVSRGENAVESNHVKDMMFDGELLVIRGNVHASMRDRVYKVEIKLDSDHDIDEATCSCPRGQLLCHHMAALAIFAYQNVSVTDVACTWSSKTQKGNGVKTIDELYNSKGHSAVSGNVADEKVEVFKKQLGLFENAVGFTWLLREEPSVPEDIVDVESVVFSNDYLEADDKASYVEKCLQMTQEKIFEISKKTVGQSTNAMWAISRKNRLTSSNFGVVLSAIRRNRYPSSLFKRLTESYTLDGIKAIQWGKEHEADGVLVFEKNRGANVSPTGIWLDKCGFIGGSPDGLINEDSIIEVKCPYKLRESKSLTQDLRDKNYILYIDDQNAVVLNSNHDYYHQIQGNLYLTKRKICHLVIWTPMESIIYDVSMDEDWGKNINILKKFYLDMYIPFLSGNRKK